MFSVRVVFMHTITSRCRVDKHPNAARTCSQAGVGGGGDSVSIEAKFSGGSGGVPTGFREGFQARFTENAEQPRCAWKNIASEQTRRSDLGANIEEVREDVAPTRRLKRVWGRKSDD